MHKGNDNKTSNINSYIQSLCTSLNQVECTDLSKGSLDFVHGMDLAVDRIEATAGRGNKILFVGNGGSAGITSHAAIDYMRTAGMRTLCFNDGAMLTCLSNDFGYEQVFEKPVGIHADAGDVLVAISSSGQSENILRAVTAARTKKCQVFTLSGFESDNPLRMMGDLNFYVPSQRYGYVEIAHQILVHAILDLIMERRLR